MINKIKKKKDKKKSDKKRARKRDTTMTNLKASFYMSVHKKDKEIRRIMKILYKENKLLTHQ